MAARFLIGLLIILSISLLGAGLKEPGQPFPPPGSDMTLPVLQNLLHEVVQDLNGESGQWRFTLEGVEMALLTSVPHDRMRIVAPIGPVDQLTEEQRMRMLEANFHSALDARYATSHGMVYAAYIHPLSPLRPDEIRSALKQVAALVTTFGTTYSSGVLLFGAPSPRGDHPARKPQPPPL